MKKILSILLVLSMCITLVSCTKENKEEEYYPEIQMKKGVINLQMRDPDILDPILTGKLSVRDALLTVYEPLFNVTDTFALEPVLAETFAFNEGATVMTLKLKEGVLWHNNHVLTADDVIYTVNRIKENPSSSYYLNLEKLERAEKLSDYEVVFYLTGSYALFVYNLYFPIMHVNEDVASCVGTGPYRFKETDGKQLVLEKNTAWHMGEVKNDGVKFIYMKTTEMAQEAFSSGKIHAVTKNMLDTENFAIKGSHTKHIYTNGLFEFMGFNNTQGVFTDPLIRNAASHAINRDELAQLFDGATPSAFPVMRGSSAFSPVFETVNYSGDYAREIIFSAGWIDYDGDGVPSKMLNGMLRDLSVTIIVATQDSVRVQAAEMIKNHLTQAGFKVNVDVVDITAYNTRIYGGEFDIFLGAVYYDSPYDMTHLLTSSGPINYMGYRSGRMDDAIKLFSSSPDIDTATLAFSKIQSIYNEEQPIAGVVFRNSYVLTNSSVEGEINPFPYSPYANISNWIIK